MWNQKKLEEAIEESQRKMEEQQKKLEEEAKKQIEEQKKKAEQEQKLREAAEEEQKKAQLLIEEKNKAELKRKIKDEEIKFRDKLKFWSLTTPTTKGVKTKEGKMEILIGEERSRPGSIIHPDYLSTIEKFNEKYKNRKVPYDKFLEFIKPKEVAPSVEPEDTKTPTKLAQKTPGDPTPALSLSPLPDLPGEVPLTEAVPLPKAVKDLSGQIAIEEKKVLKKIYKREHKTFHLLSNAGFVKDRNYLLELKKFVDDNKETPNYN